jgi:glycosyltransferase involved in cell wall biosynthesis
MPWGERLGGAETMLWALLRHIDRSRVEPHVIALQSGPFEREIAALGVPTTVVEAGRLRQAGRTVTSVRTIARLLRAERPDVIVNWSPKTHLYGGTAARLVGLSDRVVWWQHGISDGNWLDRLATALPARAVGCSSRASALAQQRLWPHRPTFVVHPGIDPPGAVSGSELEELRKRLGLSPKRIVVGMVGRLQPDKGQDRLLCALALLRRGDLDVHALIVGGDAYGLSPGYARDLQRLVRDLDLDDAVTMTGQVDHVAPYVQLMDVFVSLSEAESFGIVLLEAMALGVPALVAASGGPLEIIEPGRSGVLTDASDPEALVRPLVELIRDSNMRQRLAEEGRRTAAHFSATRMVEEMQTELEELVVRES